jgi:glucose-6-phosphate isomerase, archaeal
MNIPIQPSLAHIDLNSGIIAGAADITERHLSDMPGFFQDQQVVHDLLPSDPLMYRVYLTHQGGDANGLYTGTSVIEPGHIGREFYMTKGHFHLALTAPEVYLTLSGQGLLLMQTRSGETEIQPMQPGAMNYIPGDWAHRTINTGTSQLVFFAVWPVSAGHDYDSIAHGGFAQLVIVGSGGPQIVANPNFVPSH